MKKLKTNEIHSHSFSQFWLFLCTRGRNTKDNAVVNLCFRLLFVGVFVYVCFFLIIVIHYHDISGILLSRSSGDSSLV